VLGQIDISITFITGHGDIPMTVKAMKGGTVEFLTKPLRGQDLDAVRVALDRDRQRREGEKKARDLRARQDSLSPREKEVMALVTAGFINKQAAHLIGLTEITVKFHRHNLMKKLGARSLVDLVRFADTLGGSRVMRSYPPRSEREARDLRARYDSLSPREKEVMALVTAGLINKQAAHQIGVTEITVKFHRHNLMKKLGARSLVDLVRFADTLGVSRAMRSCPPESNQASAPHPSVVMPPANDVTEE
jgi:FixJ family two-component response regulator